MFGGCAWLRIGRRSRVIDGHSPVDEAVMVKLQSATPRVEILGDGDAVSLCVEVGSEKAGVWRRGLRRFGGIRPCPPVKICSGDIEGRDRVTRVQAVERMATRGRAS
ncbi:Uncharacterized protein Rs2_21948 [Raphanus sativus]|nr:Uncharacterized protein Rs2_21948 [Raphanus sativus]